jgi:hypothetical protein
MRDNSRQLTIKKDSKHTITFKDFTALAISSPISAIQMEKFCISDILGYVIQINMLQQQEDASEHDNVHPSILAILQEFEDLFSQTTTLLPQRECDHAILLKDGRKPPNLRPYRVSP